jgi:2-octaprenyl-6-methoxyphenol hydroxylase
MDNNYDIAIIGGGMAGMIQAIILARQGWQVACIDRETVETHTDKSFDVRTTAISWGSRNLLTHADVWNDLKDRAEAIRDIYIRDEDSPINLDFNIADVHADGFGWIIDNRDIRQTLIHHMCKYGNLTHMTGMSVTDFKDCGKLIEVTLSGGQTINARLVIGADGRKSFTRQWMGIDTFSHDYRQSAIVCLMTHEKPHEGVALEHFRAQGPFAVLPYIDDEEGRHQSSIVWTVEAHEAENWTTCNEDLFNAAIQARCGDLYGEVRVKGARAAWPLNIIKAKSYIGHRFVLIAEAAHGIHPIAGQGLNMSLRDIAALSEILEGQSDPGVSDILSKYQKMRRQDNYTMAAGTHILNELFGFEFFGIRAIRRFGLHAVSQLPFAKKFFMRQAMGANGNLPKMIREAV